MLLPYLANFFYIFRRSNFNFYILGDTICVIRGRKGTYIRTSQGRIFAVRLNDTQRFTSAQSEPATRLSLANPMVSAYCLLYYCALKYVPQIC